MNHWPMSLAPTNEESAWLGKKTYRKEKNYPSGRKHGGVDSFRLLTTKRKIWKRVEIDRDVPNLCVS